MSKQYVLDANVFIEAKNRYYAFDICPGYWSSLITQFHAKRLCSIDRIAEELNAQDDSLKQWIKQKAPEDFFKGTQDQAVIDQFQRMVQWVYGQERFTPAAKSDFASVADGWVVAYAAAGSLVVVTQEQYRPDARNNVPIPNVCREFEVEYVDLFTLLRGLGEKFIRSTKRKQKP